jgi:hypothetical protein
VIPALTLTLTVPLPLTLALTLVLPASVSLPGSSGGEGGPPSQTAPDASLQLERVRGVVARAHGWLIQQQNKDGSFSIVRNEASKTAPVAVTSLAALSLMAAGNLPDRGEYDRAVRRAVDWLVDHAREDGYVTTDADTISRMHGHGYAVLAMTQAYGMYTRDPVQSARLRAAVERGVRLIEGTQGETGGWYYDPRKVSPHEGSITVCMIQALRAARDVGLAVDARVIDKAVGYMQRSQDPDNGRFRYAINDPKTSWALTAAALSTLNALGDYGSESVVRGFAALEESDPFTGMGRLEAFIDYGALYAAQAYWQYRDRAVFDRWWPSFVTACTERQRPDGDFGDNNYGNVYATAIVSLTLQVPLGYLPLFQR